MSSDVKLDSVFDISLFKNCLQNKYLSVKKIIIVMYCYYYCYSKIPNSKVLILILSSLSLD